MSDLLLLRHATALPQDTTGDRERPLDLSGRRSAEALARWISDHRLAPDTVLCSPARRTRQTLEIIASAMASAPIISFEDALYLAPAERLLGRLRRIATGTKSVLVVGHNPGLHELALALSDVRSGPLMARLGTGFPASALARFEIEVSWSALDRRIAHLAAFVTPNDLIRGSR